ncbi:hypothetical protein ACGK9R_10315 [Halomonas sp. HNIBRBA4712]|uniref:hypothetical protein n=1 Tax=Halomonas sp. HNIBRBA4712 TaxID=3373087 RepID=UPI003745D665
MPDRPQDGGKQFWQQKRQHCKEDNTGNQVGTAKKPSPMPELFVDPEPNKDGGWDREKQ